MALINNNSAHRHLYGNSRSTTITASDNGVEADEWTITEAPLKMRKLHSEGRKKSEMLNGDRSSQDDSTRYHCTYPTCDWTIDQMFPERFRSHLRCHLLGKPFKCYECGTVSVDVPSQNLHSKSHRAIRGSTKSNGVEETRGSKRRRNESPEGTTIPSKPRLQRLTYHQRNLAVQEALSQLEPTSRFTASPPPEPLRLAPPDRETVERKPFERKPVERTYDDFSSSEEEFHHFPPVARRAPNTQPDATVTREKSTKIRGRQPQRRPLALTPLQLSGATPAFADAIADPIPLPNPPLSPVVRERFASIGSSSSSMSPPPPDSPDAGLPPSRPEKFITSDGTKLYCCSVADCQKMFRRMEHLKRHSKIHSKVKPYQCPYASCGKFFARSDNLKQHTKVHADEDSIESLETSRLIESVQPSNFAASVLIPGLENLAYAVPASASIPAASGTGSIKFKSFNPQPPSGLGLAPLPRPISTRSSLRSISPRSILNPPFPSPVSAYRPSSLRSVESLRPSTSLLPLPHTMQQPSQFQNDQLRPLPHLEPSAQYPGRRPSLASPSLLASPVMNPLDGQSLRPLPHHALQQQQDSKFTTGGNMTIGGSGNSDARSLLGTYSERSASTGESISESGSISGMGVGKLPRRYSNAHERSSEK